jgi:YVTN family beta-propeller protein
MRICVRMSGFAGPVLAACAAMAMIAGPARIVAQQPYQVIDQWKIGGEGFWDYMTVDSAAHRLYITHGVKVDVVDTDSGKVVGEITGLHGIHGVALDDSGTYGYISDGGANAVVVFDRKTLEKVARIEAGKNPDGIVYEPSTKTVWAFNGRSDSATVIDTVGRTVVATIPLPGKPEFPAVDGQGNVYDNIESKNEIVRLDAHAYKVTAEWPTGCDSPSGLAMDQAGHRLFSVCDGRKMSVIEATTGKSLALPPIGQEPDAAAFSPEKNLAFASCGEGVLTVIDASSPAYAAIENLPTQRGARTMAYDPATDRAYLVTADFGPAPAATKEHPHPRPSIVPGSFAVIVVGRK